MLEKKEIYTFIGVFICVFIADQGIKFASLNGLRYEGEYLSLVLVFNDGVAFSMLSFLKAYLKYLHLVLIVALFLYLWWQKKFLKEHLIAFAIMFSAGTSNLLDRFIHTQEGKSGVVDMFFWHKWFEFAVFNFADVMINLSVALILIEEFILKRKKNVE